MNVPAESPEPPEPPRIAALMVAVLGFALVAVTVSCGMLARDTMQLREELLTRFGWAEALGALAADNAGAGGDYLGVRDGLRTVDDPDLVTVLARIDASVAAGGQAVPADIALAMSGVRREELRIGAGFDRAWNRMFFIAGTGLLLATLTAGLLIIANRRRAILSQERTQLSYRATHDGLTGLWNRASVLDALCREKARSVRDQVPVGVLMLDLDGFKKLNDRFGHLAGDAVLREVARRMQIALRPYDTVGRFGGEEFLVVLPACDQERAALLAERLRAAIANRPMSTGEVNVAVTISAGVTSMLGDEEPLHLVRKADDALLVAKRAGGNLAVVASPRVH